MAMESTMMAREGHVRACGGHAMNTWWTRAGHLLGTRRTLVRLGHCPFATPVPPLCFQNKPLSPSHWRSLNKRIDILWQNTIFLSCYNLHKPSYSRVWHWLSDFESWHVRLICVYQASKQCKSNSFVAEFNCLGSFPRSFSHRNDIYIYLETFN